MDEAERKKFDEYGASGLLPALRLRVMSFCAPLWWEVGGRTILANGTMCIIATPVALFGVTNDHVLRIYEKHRAENGDVFCRSEAACLMAHCATPAAHRSSTAAGGEARAAVFDGR
jgi:hypothetical protein